MYCSPLLHAPGTVIPPSLRDWLGAGLAHPQWVAHPIRRSACIYALGWFGDMVLGLSAIRLLLGAFGAKDCVLVVSDVTADLIEREFPGVDRLFLPVDAASLTRDIMPLWWRERPKASRWSFDHCICLSHQRSLYYELALSWIRAEKDARLTPASYPATPGDGLCTELLAHRQLVEGVLGRKVSREEILPRFTSLPVGDDGRLLVYPLTRDPSRSLHVGYTCAILRRWRERSRAPIVFGGSPGDAAGLEYYLRAARRSGLEPVGCETPSGTGGFLTHIARAGAVLAAESAPAHVATALDKPTVALMEGRLHGYCQPWSRSRRQHVYLHDTSAETVAEALPSLDDAPDTAPLPAGAPPV